jgi:membrane protease YdiL (CAAX protease family)
MASVLWLPGVWSSTHDFLRHTLPSHAWPSEIGAAIHAIAAIALVAFILVRGSESLQRFGFSKPSMKLVGWVIAALAVVAVIGLADWVWEFAGYVGKYWNGRYPLGRVLSHPTLPVALLTTVIPIRAFGEEVVFRAYFTTRLVDVWGSKAAAVAVGALAFAAGHLYQGLLGATAIFFIGVVWAGVFLRTKSIWPSTFAHVGYNLFVYTGVLVPPTLWLVRHMCGIP